MKLKELLPGTLGFGAAPLGNMFRDIPADFWRELRNAGLVDPLAPLPIDN